MSTIPEQLRPDSGGSSHSPTPAAAHSGSRRNSVTTFSTQMSLAKALHERGTDHPSMTPTELSAPAALLGGCWSGLSTPNNSPESSGRSSPAGAVFLGPLDLLQQGARMIQRTLTGAAGGCWSEKEQPSPTLPPRIPREELEVLGYQFLLCKLLTSSFPMTSLSAEVWRFLQVLPADARNFSINYEMFSRHWLSIHFIRKI